MKKLSIRKFRESKWAKGFAALTGLSMLSQVIAPTVALALTSGPGQEEFASFEPAATSDMVDLYSGDFTYNLPIMSVPGPNGGYPINMAYHGGIGMEQEASWVGLGWNLNVGAVNRQLQGLPDDFKGDQVEYEMHTRKSWEVGFEASWLGTEGEIYGFPDPTLPQSNGNWISSLSTELYFNNYKGLGYRIHAGAPLLQKEGYGISSGLSLDSQNGVGFSVSTNVDVFFTSWGLNLSYSPRNGANGIGVNSSLKFGSSNQDSDNKSNYVYGNSRMTSSSYLSFSQASGLPSINVPQKNNTVPFSLRIGDVFSPGRWVTSPPRIWSGSYTQSTVAKDGKLTQLAYGYSNTRKTNNNNDLQDYNQFDVKETSKNPYLTPSRYTYDNYVHTGQGTGGSFRAMRNNIPILSTAYTESISITDRAGFEAAGGAGIHVGLDYVRGKGISSSGDWQKRGNGGGNVLYDWVGLDTEEFDSKINQTESSPYYKVYGEHTAMLEGTTYNNSESNLANWHNDEAMMVNLDKDGGWLERDYTMSTSLSERPKLTDWQLQQSNILYQAGLISAPLTQVELEQIDDLKEIQRTKRRGKMIRTLSVEEAEQFGYYREADFSRPEHLTSEVQVHQQDGMRYVYGLAAYNNSHSDVSMSVTNVAAGDHNTNVVDLNEGDHLTQGISSSREYFKKSTLPEYAHSWLLTSVLSPDYIDIDAIPGPSDDDYGYWTKFNYKKVHDNYQWRTPYQGATFAEGNIGDVTDDMGFFSYGNKEIHYIESIETQTHIAIFHTSERKDAADAFDEYAQTGETGSNHLHKLDKIELFTKKEYYLANGTINPDRTPLQTTHFVYNYDLCQNVPNNPGTSVTPNSNELSNEGGKLTLVKVYFTYEDSNRGELSPYTFVYGEEDNTPLETEVSTINPTYDQRNVDRWGSYKKNEQYGGAGEYPYVNFPYTEQGSDYAANGSTPVEKAPAGAWCLRRVDLPTGGVFRVQYEKDDYAYVEGEKATRMFDVVAIGNDISQSGDNIYMDRTEFSDENFQQFSQTNTENIGVRNGSIKQTGDLTLHHHLPGQSGYQNRVYRIYFRLEEPIDGSISASDLNKKIVNEYVGDMQYLYFKNLSYLRSDDDKTVQDYVAGYAELDDETNNVLKFGAIKDDVNSNYTLGYVTLKPVSVGKVGTPKMHPFRKAAIEHIRVNRPELAHDVFIQDGSVASMVASMALYTVTALDDVAGMIAGYNRYGALKGWGKYIDLNGKSIIRLQDADGFKQGGGDRVAQFSISDNWTEGVSSYGQTYDYTKEENGRIISSGVAYEPHHGKEESALTTYQHYSESTPLASPYGLMVEQPLLSPYYPGASVGYSKVTVSSIAPKEADKTVNGSETGDILLASTSTPVSIYEFYTGKDFPVYSDITSIKAEPKIYRLVPVPGIAMDQRVKAAKSQGYSIVLNDMAGKPKSISSYKSQLIDENGKVKSIASTAELALVKTEYEYHTQTAFSAAGNNKLSSTVKVLTDDGNYQNGELGQTVDIHIDRNENKSETRQFGFNVNIESVLPWVIPIPQYYHSEYSHKTIVTNKVIHRSGILKSTKVTTDGSEITTENLAYDVMTGEPLLMQVKNEHEDPVYSYNIPARWHYENMGEVYQRFDGFETLLSVPASGGVINCSNSAQAATLKIGDEISLKYNTGAVENHVFVVGINSNQVTCIDFQGNPIPNGTVSNVEMVRPIERNLLAVKVGGLSAKELVNFGTLPTGVSQTFTYNKILNASATEFSDEWQTDCANCSFYNDKTDVTINQNNVPGNVVNPYRNGIKGNWRTKSSYAYKTERVRNNDIKEDGYYTDFSPFNWGDPTASSDKWIKAGTVTKISPFGFQLEEKDVLGNYSAAVYGYGNALVTAIGGNMRYNQISFDGFEDYPGLCNEDHFRFDVNAASNARLTLENEGIAHTGIHALAVNGGTELHQVFDAKMIQCDDYEYQPRGSFTLSECNCIGKFGPDNSTEPTKYVVSAWVKESDLSHEYTTPSVVLEMENGSGTSFEEIFYPTGKVIEGWQRVYGEFSVPADLVQFKVRLKNDGASEAYFDDLRIHPFLGNMKSFVYDPVDYKLRAELDANNFATFYLYDDEGNMLLMKKETEEGVKTIQEGRSSTNTQ